MRGRKSKPSKTKELEGNPGKRAPNDREPAALDGAPEAPPHLNDEARAEWFRICADLKEMGILSRADRPAIAAYCEAWARWVDACERYKGMGPVIKTSNGNLIQNPLVGVIRRANDDLRKWIVEFGLTPCSKTRLNTIDETVDTDELTMFA